MLKKTNSEEKQTVSPVMVNSNPMDSIVHNIVRTNPLREAQKNTLTMLREALTCSFGPLGSTTIITGDTELPKYTKDGHTILENIKFGDIVEQTTTQNILDVTNNIVLEVGDGTTSAVILSSIIFEQLCSHADEYNATPHEIVSAFSTAVKELSDYIKNNAVEFTPEMAYHIAYTSTNSNTFIAETIADIYKKYGNDVYITVSSSVDENTYIKNYDGVTLETGYASPAYITDSTKGVSSLSNPKIYAFENAVDTPEMMRYFTDIINANILTPYQEQKIDDVEPTVILVPGLSRDAETFLGQLEQFMYSMANSAASVPLLIVNNISDEETYHDIYHLCGCKPIKKYIDKKIYDLDVEKGLAPTAETILDFCGSAELVEADLGKTKFINPAKMFKEGTTEYSDEFISIVNFLEAELKKAYELKESINTTGNLKRRINSLKANMVDIYVGGISIIDRDSLIYLVDDAIKNCRSASRNGVGYGANFEGLRASTHFGFNDGGESSGGLVHEMHCIIKNAYENLAYTLYRTKYLDAVAEPMIKKSVENDAPFNLHTGTFSRIHDVDGQPKILSSIDTDPTILEAIAKIVTVMYTSNQLLTSKFTNNKYMYKR